MGPRQVKAKNGKVYLLLILTRINDKNEHGSESERLWRDAAVERPSDDT